MTTVEDRLRMTIGSLVLENHSLAAKLEVFEEAAAEEKKAAIEKATIEKASAEKAGS